MNWPLIACLLCPLLVFEARACLQLIRRAKKAEAERASYMDKLEGRLIELLGLQGKFNLLLGDKVNTDERLREERAARLRYEDELRTTQQRMIILRADLATANNNVSLLRARLRKAHR